MTNNTHVPLIVHIVFRFDIGGLENGVVNLINSMPDKKYRHAIICLTDHSDFFFRIKKKNIKIYDLHKQEGYDFKIYYALWKLLRRLKPSIVHTRNFATMDCQFATLMAGKIHRIHGEHGWDMVDLSGTNKKHIFLRKFFSFIIERYIVLSSQSGEYLRKSIAVNSKRIVQIYNGVDTEKYVEKPFNSTSVKTTKIVFGTVGRMAEVKNQLFLIEVLRYFLDEFPEYKNRIVMHIIGDGPLYETAQGLVNEYQLEKNCFLLGKSDQVQAVMQTLDVFILPSLAEGISNTILEAMASGLPVIASDVGGNKELIDEGITGFIIPVNDKKALVNKMKFYVDNTELRLNHGKNARKEIERKFSLNKMVEQYTQVYDDVLNT